MLSGINLYTASINAYRALVAQWQVSHLSWHAFDSHPMPKPLQLDAVLVPSPDRMGGLHQEGHPALKTRPKLVCGLDGLLWQPLAGSSHKTTNSIL